MLLYVFTSVSDICEHVYALQRLGILSSHKNSLPMRLAKVASKVWFASLILQIRQDISSLISTWRQKRKLEHELGGLRGKLSDFESVLKDKITSILSECRTRIWKNSWELLQKLIYSLALYLKLRGAGHHSSLLKYLEKLATLVTVINFIVTIS